MKFVAIFLAFLAPALAKPNGFYHQEYNYQTSSSSYKNHELQHRNDDEGYYSKDGDLEGRVRPRVNAHSQHSEYVNPKMQQGYRIGTDRTSSFGQLHAQNRYRFGEPPIGNPEMGAGFGSIGPHQEYGVRSNLRDITGGLQSEIERELQRAVYEQYQRAAAYGGTITQTQIEEDRRALEEELRRNVTMRLQEALKVHYGNQGIRGAYSYSIMDGRLQPTANYNNQELVDLRRQMEENLMRHLNQQVQTTYHTRVDTQVHTTRNTYRGVNGDNYPSPIQQRPVVYHQYPPIQPQPHPQPHPVSPIPDSITTVATRVQTELNEILNKILEDTQRRYFAENSYHSGVNYDVVLAQLQNELRNNITFHFDDQIKRAYGYTNYASKYSVEDIENLRRQIEANLITKLNRDYNRQREKFLRTQQIYIAPRPIPANHVFYPVNNIPVNNINQHTEIAAMQSRLQEQLSRQLQDALMRQSYRQAHMYTGAANYNPQANYEAILQQLSAELNSNLTRQMEMINMQQFQSGAYEAQIANMRNQLQHDLMRQLQQGLQQSYSRSSSWSSSSSSSSNANYRPVRGFDPNLYRADVMGEDCMMGDDPSVYQQQDDGDEDLTQQTEQLNQEPNDSGDLTQQSQQLNQQEALDDEDLTQQTEQLNQEPNESGDLTQQSQQLNQQEALDDEDLTQQTEQLNQEPNDSGDVTQQSQQLNQQEALDDEDLTQQTEQLNQEPNDSGDLTQQSQQLNQQEALDDDLQNEDENLNQPGSVRTPNIQTQNLDNIKPFAPVSEPPIQRVQYRPVYQSPLSVYRPPPPVYAPVYRPQSHDLTQQTQTLYPEYQQIQDPQLYPASPSRPQTLPPIAPQNPSPQVWPHREPQHHPTRAYTSTYDWTPQRRYPENRVGDRIRYYENLNSPHTHYRRWKPLNQQTQDVPRGQQVDNSDLTQQTQDVSGQYQENDDLTQQIQDPGFGKLQIGNQQRPDLSQQVSVLRDQQSRDLTRPNPFLNQQTQDLAQQSRDLTAPNQYLAQQTQDLTRPNQYLNQQTQDLNQNQDLTQQTQDLTEQTQDPTRPNQYLNQQTQDLTQQTQDLTQQTQDLTRPNEHYLHQQTQDLTRPSQYLNQQTQDLTQQTQDLTQQTQDLTRPNEHYLHQQTQDLTRPSQYLNQQTQDLTQQTQDLTQQTQDLTRPNQHYLDQQTQDLTQQTQDLTRPNQHYLDQQTQDLTQQTQDLTRPNQHYLDQQTQDLTRQRQVLNQYQDLTQQSRDLTRPNQYLNQQTRDLTRPSQDFNQQVRDLNQYRDLSQQSEEFTKPKPYSQQTQDLNQYQDLTQQTQDLTQQARDLPRPNQYLNQQTQDLTEQTEDLTPSNQQYLNQQTQDLTQQTQHLTQQTEDLTQETEDLREPNQGFDQQTRDLTQQSQDLTRSDEYLNQQTQDLTQQTEDLTESTQHTEDSNQYLNQQTQDLTQQTEDETLTQQIQDPGFGKLPLGNQRTSDLVQQQAELLTDQQKQDLNEKTEDIDQPIEPQIATNKISEPSAKQVAEQTQDLIQQEINQNQEQFQDTLPQQRENSVTTEETDQQNLRDAERRSQHLIDLLKRQKNQDGSSIGPMQYHPQPVHTELHGQQVQVGTTRQLAYHSVSKGSNPPSYAQQVEEAESNTETVQEIEPIEPQVASEVQQVGDAQEPDVTTKKPGWWSRQMKKFKNKLGYNDDV